MDAVTRMIFEDIILSEINQSQNDKYGMTLCEVPRVIGLIGTERMIVASSLGEEEVVEAAIIIANIDGLLGITFMQNIR